MPPRKLIQVSDLDDDVLFEIFLAFVAIDWDGPFTLTLVCTKWRDLVFSKPRLWTWIMIDSTQADWKERVDVTAYISNELPLQVCLRIPFTSTSPMTYITRRCTDLIVDSDQWNHTHLAKMWPDVHAATRISWVLDDDVVKQSIMDFLKDAPADQIEIMDVNGSTACSYYPMWTIYDDYTAGKPLIIPAMNKFPYYLTALAFNTEEDERSDTPLQLSQLWEILSSLPRLGYLEVSDTIVNSRKPVALPPLSMSYLQSIVLISPMSHQVLFSFEEDTWLGLFSLLDYLSIPLIEHMALRGSVHRILAAMMGMAVSVCPSNLVVEVSSFDEPVGKPALEQNRAWHKLVRLTICLLESKRMFSRISTKDSADAVCSLIFFAPRTCSVRVYTDIQKLAPLGLHHNQAIYASDAVRWLILVIAELSGCILLQTGSFTERVAVEGQRLVAKSLYLYDDWLLVHQNSELFEHLVDLRLSPRRMNKLLRTCNLKNLRAVTLSGNYPGDENDFVNLASTLMRREDTLPRLITLSMGRIYAWRPLIEILGNFGKSKGRGISTLNLPYLPDPYIIREIILALTSRQSGYRTEHRDGNWDVYARFQGTPGCWDCFKTRRSCFGTKGECTRSSRRSVVSITKDSTLPSQEEASPVDSVNDFDMRPFSSSRDNMIPLPDWYA